MTEAFPNANAGCVKDRISLRGLENKWLHILNAEASTGQTIGCALNVQIGALRTVVSHVEQQRWCEFLLDIEVPNLHVAKLVILIHGEVVRNRGGRRWKSVLERERQRCRRYICGSCGERRLECQA